MTMCNSSGMSNDTNCNKKDTVDTLVWTRQPDGTQTATGLIDDPRVGEFVVYPARLGGGWAMDQFWHGSKNVWQAKKDAQAFYAYRLATCECEACLNNR